MTSRVRPLAAMIAAALLTGSLVGTSPASAAPPVSAVLSGSPAQLAHARGVVNAHGSVLADLPVASSLAVTTDADTLAALSKVVRVTPNFQGTVSAVSPVVDGPASDVYPLAINADKVSAKGQGVTVAVVDTGIDVSGPLATKVVAGVDVSGEMDPTTDSYGHGTFVAGLVTGTAPGANLVSAKIAGRDGATDVIRLLMAVQWVVANRAAYSIDVLNLSLNFPGTQSYVIDPVAFALEQAVRSGITVIVSAGNDGGPLIKPADDPWLISVGATDDHGTAARNDDTTPAFSSGTASNPPSLSAPGTHLVSVRAPGSAADLDFPGSRVEDGYFRGSGTSFSSAVTAGAAAVLLSSQPGLRPAQVKQRLVSTATQTGLLDARGGAGSLDLQAATLSGDMRGSAPSAPPSLGGSVTTSAGQVCVRLSDTSLLGGCLGGLDLSPSSLASSDSSGWSTKMWSTKMWSTKMWSTSTWSTKMWSSGDWQ